MTLDEITAALREQHVPPDSARVAGLLVAPDVWEKLMAAVPPAEPGAPVAPWVSWRVTVDKWLAPGTIIPIDADGKPILKPRTTSDLPGSKP